MDSRIFIKLGWLYIVGILFIGLFQIDTRAEIIGGDNPWRKKEAYYPYPILFLHGFAGGSNYTWNPDPNAENQAEEIKKPTAVLNKYFEKYFRVNKSLGRTQQPYLETMEFFNRTDPEPEQVIDRNSSVDTYKGGLLGDHYVLFGNIDTDGRVYKRQEGDPGWADKVSYALRSHPFHPLSKYLYDRNTSGPILEVYMPPSGDFTKVILVCHSMGGLSAREYVTNSKYANQYWSNYGKPTDHVAGIVTVGTPHLGSPLATAANAAMLAPFIPYKSAIAWAMIGGIIAVMDGGSEWFAKIDPQGDAVNDMDPKTLLFFGSGYLGELEDRQYPTNVPVRVIYSKFTPGQQFGGALQQYISELVEEGMPKDMIKEILKAVGIVIDESMNIVSYAIGDGVVTLESQQGITYYGKRVFKLDNPIQAGDKVIKPEVEIRGFHGDEAIPAVSETGDEASALLKLIDYTKPRLEIASPQEGFIWESGATIMLEGKVYDEYLPADCSLKIELYKAGDNFNPVFSEVRKPDPITGYTPLKPTTLWDPNKPSSPVAEFKEEVSLPSGANPEATYTIKLTVINPAGISSEPKQVTEKTFYLYGVAKDGSGVSRLWCIDGPTSFANGVGAVVSEFDLVDEQGQNISANPLDIATSGNTIWVSFDDKKIRKYNIYGEEDRVDSTRWYWTASNMPDGLYYDGNLQYCSSETNRLYRVNSSGVENELGVINRRLSLDGVPTDSLNVNYTTQEYINYNPTGISGRFLCSTGTGKISRREISANNFLQTLPSASPIWANEQGSPSGCVGIAEVADSSVPEGYVVYLSCTNGNIYKVRFKDKGTIGFNIGGFSSAVIRIFNEGDNSISYDYWSASPGPLSRRDYWYGLRPPIRSQKGRVYRQIDGLQSFIEARIIRRTGFDTSQNIIRNGVLRWEGQTTVPVKSSSVYIAYLNYTWNNEQIFTQTTLGTMLYERLSTDNPEDIYAVDVSNSLPKGTFSIAEIYNGENDFYPLAIPESNQEGSVAGMINRNFDSSRWIAYLTDKGSLEILDQFTAPAGIWEGIGTGSRINMRIKTGYPSSINIGGAIQLEAHGKESLAWITSDENVGKVDSNGLFTAVGKGTCTVTVQDALGNIATSGVITVQ